MSHNERRHASAGEAVAGADRALRVAIEDVNRCRNALAHALREESHLWRLVASERAEREAVRR